MRAKKQKNKTKPGKLVVIDGIDGSGKATQTKLLVERLRKQGKKVKAIDFPQYYSNFFGGFLGECLTGKHGDFLALDPYITSVIYAADRFESSEKIKKWLEQGYIVVVDRYVSANQIHQGGKILEAKQRAKFLDWIENVEYAVFKIPRPNMILFLDVPLKESQKLLSSKRLAMSKDKKYLNGSKDLHENNPEHLRKAKQSAVSAVKKRNKWTRIDCTRNNQLMTKNQISDMIWAKVKRILK